MLYKSLLLSGLLSGCSVLYAEKQPNIVLFLVDDMGVMDTSVPFLLNKNGTVESQPLNKWYHTPNMELMAQKGVCFSSFYAQSVSSPSRSTLMTGQNSTRHQTTTWINATSNNRTKYGPENWNWKGLNPHDPLLPKLLHEGGYKTIHVGKAHFGPQGSDAEDPRNIGFDVNIGGSGIGHPGSYYGEDGYGSIKGSKSHAVPHLEKYHGTNTFLTDALTQEANEQISKAVKEDKPFFLYLSHYAVHAPFQPDKRYIDKYSVNSKGKQADAYASLIEGMDKSLGDLMEHLEKVGVAENTLVIFIGDNGGDAPLGDATGHFSSAPLRGKKGSVYEGGTRVPCIVSWAKPANNKIQSMYPVKQGKTLTQLGTVMDIYPTILDVADIKPVKGFSLDGVSLAKQMSGRINKSRPESVLMHFPHGEHRGVYFTSYREGDWKLIYHYNPENPENPGCELYNLKQDPYENIDLKHDETARVKHMIRSMAKELKRQNALYPVDKNGNELRPVIQ